MWLIGNRQSEPRRAVTSPGISSQDVEPGEEESFDRPGGGADQALRHLLLMIGNDPSAARAPQQMLARLRPFVDGARIDLQSLLGDEHVGDMTRLLHGAVSGLCDIARFSTECVAERVIS